MSMTGKAAVKREDAEAEAVTRAAEGGERDEKREKPSQMRGWIGTRRRYPFYRDWGKWEKQRARERGMIWRTCR